MVGGTVMVVRVANVSAEVWQNVACFTEHVSSWELLDIICCLPIEQLGRLAFCLWTFFCLPPSPHSSSFYSYYYDDESDRDTSSDSSSSSRSYYYAAGYNSHSD